MSASTDLQIKKDYVNKIQTLWSKQRYSMNDALFLNHVLNEAEDWGLEHGDTNRITKYVKELLEKRWEGVRPKLRKEVEEYFEEWIIEQMTEKYATFDPNNKQVSWLVNDAETVWREKFYSLDIVHPEEWDVVRSWMWGRIKNFRNPVEKGMKILWPVAMAYSKETGKPVKGGQYRLDAVNMDQNAERPKERRFRACLHRRGPKPREENARIVGGIDEDGMICICQQAFTDRIMYFEVTGFTRNRTACFVKPVEARRRNSPDIFRFYDVEMP